MLLFHLILFGFSFVYFSQIIIRATSLIIHTDIHIYHTNSLTAQRIFDRTVRVERVLPNERWIHTDPQRERRQHAARGNNNE